jgi:PAS domain S-box-containing protein/putative nucleotidyltransferase with HDIG domain
MLSPTVSCTVRGGWVDLRILFVEDMSDDVELMLRRLREAGIEPQWERVDTGARLRAALADRSWQIALVDFNLPSFSGPRAIGLLAELAPDTPAITVSGAVSEETAVATITAGAVDYVLKDNLTRLAPAVLRAVEGAELRRRQRRAAEAARLALFAVDHASMSIMTVAASGTIIYVNDYACDEFGAPREEMVGAKLWDYEQSVSAAEWPERWEALKKSRVDQYETDRVGPDGSRHIADVTANYLEEADCIISYGRNITGKRLAEERAHASEEMYRRIVETAREGIWAMDRDYRTAFVNPRMAEILGYEVEEMVGRLVTDFMFEEDLGEQGAAMRLLSRQESGTYQVRLRCRRGDEVWASVSWTADLGPEGEFLGSVGMFTDITERKRAEEALRESEARFRLFGEHLPGRLSIKDAELRYVYGNDEKAAQPSLPSSRWIGKTPEELWTPEEARAVRAVGERVLAGEVVEEVSETSLAHGVDYLHSVHFPIPQDNGSVLVGGISIDVTKQVEAEAEVRRQAEQLRRTVEGAVLAMSHVVETRDPYTAGHERRVSELATVIAAEMGMEGEELDALRLAGLIHDIGKIAVPAEILSKPGRLSAVEFDLIKQHPVSGFDILEAIDFGRPVAEMVLQHHERLDGSGYPKALVAADILPEAKILAVADVVEAMSSHRPYRAALGMEAALAEIRAQAGVKYDADVAAACFRVIEDQGFQFSI